MDVRFLANPYFVPELKNKNGEDSEILEFVLNEPETGKFLNKYIDMLDYLVPLYQKEGKAYLTIAIGCTGGRHRSVVIARQVYDHMRKTKSTVRLVNRDISLG
jgi:RNase adapter protein RapZ